MLSSKKYDVGTRLPAGRRRPHYDARLDPHLGETQCSALGEGGNDRGQANYGCVRSNHGHAYSDDGVRQKHDGDLQYGDGDVRSDYGDY
jgi:hypothetical protein